MASVYNPSATNPILPLTCWIGVGRRASTTITFDRPALSLLVPFLQGECQEANTDSAVAISQTQVVDLGIKEE